MPIFEKVSLVAWELVGDNIIEGGCPSSIISMDSQSMSGSSAN